MRVAMFSAKPYDRASFELANVQHDHAIDALEDRLGAQTAHLAAGSDAVCIFVNDIADREVSVSSLALACDILP